MKTQSFTICPLQTNNIYHSKLLKISLFSGPTFGDSGRSEFMLKKHSTLQKARLSIELTQYWEWAEYNTLNFAQFFPNDDQFILQDPRSDMCWPWRSFEKLYISEIWIFCFENFDRFFKLLQICKLHFDNDR